MREFIKLLDEGCEVSIHTEPNTGCYIFEFKKGKEKIKLIKPDGAFDFIEAGLIFDDLAKHAKDKLRDKQSEKLYTGKIKISHIVEVMSSKRQN